MITLDFETEAIVGNPIINPPVPVGVAVWIEGQEPFYLAWGHPPQYGGNNITWGAAHEYLSAIAESGEPLLFHNGPFDISVQNKYFCNAQLPLYSQTWKRYHDTMYLVFLADPYASTFSLKPSADRWLQMPAVEQDALRDWILANCPLATPKNYGAFIADAPADLVRVYAIGDVVRTRRLFDLLHAKIVTEGMEKAYDRERELLPTLYAGTVRGIRADYSRLEHHTGVYSTCLEMARDSLCGLLGASRDIYESDNLLADALEKSGAVTEWVLTPKSRKRSMAKENIKVVIPEVKIHMDYIGSLETCLQTFMKPWLEKASHDGRLHPNWNQVKQVRGSGGDKGTRTGRLSSDDPNYQNVPTEFVDDKGIALPIPQGLHPLPMLREYCLPEVGHLWLKRDFSSQEIRILAHFEDGALCEAYRANPDLDPHQMAVELIAALIGITYARKPVKITGFSIIYGTGATGLSLQLRGTYEEAWTIKESYLAAMPGVRDLMSDVQRRGKAGLSIRTWGGRIYYAEPSKEIDGRIRDFAYKLLNYLIQGSAADQTKQSIIDWASGRHRDSIFLATVHDEINISAPMEDWQPHMAWLKQCMNADRFDVPFRSEGFVGENWQSIKEVEESD